MGDVMRSKPTTWPSRMNSMKASQAGSGKRHVSSRYGCSCRWKSILTVETLFAEIAEDLRDDGVVWAIWPRDRDIVGMRRGSLEVVDSVCIATATAIASS